MPPSKVGEFTTFPSSIQRASVIQAAATQSERADEIKHRSRTDSKHTAYLCPNQKEIRLLLVWQRNVRNTTLFVLLKRFWVNAVWGGSTSLTLVWGFCRLVPFLSSLRKWLPPVDGITTCVAVSADVFLVGWWEHSLEFLVRLSTLTCFPILSFPSCRISVFQLFCAENICQPPSPDHVIYEGRDV